MYSEHYRQQNLREAGAELRLVLSQSIFSLMLTVGAILIGVFFRHSILGVIVAVAIFVVGIAGCRYNITRYREVRAELHRNKNPPPTLRLVP